MTLSQALPSSGSTSWYAWATAMHDKADALNLPWGAFVYRTSTNTVAVDRNGDEISNLTTSATNNVTVIQAAIDDVAGTYTPGTSSTLGHGGGGTVMFADQLFEVDDYIDVKYGVSLEGSGTFDRNGLTSSGHSSQGTMIAPTSGLGTIDVDPGAGTTTRRPVLLLGRESTDSNQVTTNPHGTRIKGIVVDCRRITTAQAVLIVDTQFVTISQCALINASGAGGAGVEIVSTIPPDDGAHGVHIHDCMIAYCDTGMIANGSGSTDGLFRDNRVVQCQTHSISLGASAGGGGWQISGCHFTCSTAEQNGGGDEGHLLLSGSPATVVNNYFDTTGGWSIYCETPMCQITGNYFKQAANSDIALIYLDGNGRKVSITGNTAQGNSTTKGFVQVSGTTGQDYRPVITGNMLGDGGGSAIVGIALDGSGNAIAESDSAMTVARDSTANAYIWGNRIVQSAV